MTLFSYKFSSVEVVGSLTEGAETEGSVVGSVDGTVDGSGYGHSDGSFPKTVHNYPTGW